METRRQHKAEGVRPGEWHCFDIPFNLVCGDMETAKEIHRHLAPFSSKFKEPLQISLANVKLSYPDQACKLWSDVDRKAGRS